MKPFQTLSADHDNSLKYSLNCEIVPGEAQLFIFNVLQNFLNTACIALFIVSKLADDYIFSKYFWISFRLFEAKFAPHIDVEGKFSKDSWKGARSNVLA